MDYGYNLFSVILSQICGWKKKLILKFSYIIHPPNFWAEKFEKIVHLTQMIKVFYWITYRSLVPAGKRLTADTIHCISCSDQSLLTWDASLTDCFWKASNCCIFSFSICSFKSLTWKNKYQFWHYLKPVEQQ